MKNQKLKNLVKKSNLLEIKDDFIVINQLEIIRGGGDWYPPPTRPKIEINVVCPIYNTGCTGIEIE